MSKSKKTTSSNPYSVSDRLKILSPKLTTFQNQSCLIHGKIVQYNPEARALRMVDESNADGNYRKRCLYESRLAKLIVEDGQDYWTPVHHKIHQFFLMDFDIKSNQTQSHYSNYFSKIETVLKKQRLLSKNKSHGYDELRAAIAACSLLQVTQFYFEVWRLEVDDPILLEPFIFLADKLGKKTATTPDQKIILLQLFPDMLNNPERWRQAYLLAQPGEMRGRVARDEPAKSVESHTIGILRDDDPLCKTLQAPSHFSAKVLYRPANDHVFTQAMQSIGAPVIAGTSGTIGRNILMLAPLMEQGLLSQQEIMQYVMGFVADVIYRGHHSFEEVAFVTNKILFPLDPSLNPLRTPIAFYRQLLTPEFCASKTYQDFEKAHAVFFDSEISD